MALELNNSVEFQNRPIRVERYTANKSAGGAKSNKKGKLTGGARRVELKEKTAIKKDKVKNAKKQFSGIKSDEKKKVRMSFFSSMDTLYPCPVPFS